MIFRQLFDRESSTYTYLLAERMGGEALLIDPVLENTDAYLRMVDELDLKLVLAVDTHIHADHVTALGALRERTDCASAMGEMPRAESAEPAVRTFRTAIRRRSTRACSASSSDYPNRLGCFRPMTITA